MNKKNETTAITKDTFTDAESFELAQRVAKGFASSSMVPPQYQNNIPNCIIAMELANRIGASVFAVMQKLAIVHNKPSFEASFLIGTVNTSGKFTPIRYRFEGEDGKDSWGCRAVATDKETGEECVGAKITIKMAKDEGWYQKKGSKWQTMAEQMLMYRSAAFWTRAYAPELSLGMNTTDELQDSIQVGQATVVERSDGGEQKTGLESLTEQLQGERPEVEPKPEPEVAPAEKGIDPESGEVLEDDENPKGGPTEEELYDEMVDLAKKLYGKQWSTAVKAKCEKLGFNSSKLTGSEFSTLIDIFNEEGNK